MLRCLVLSLLFIAAAPALAAGAQAALAPYTARYNVITHGVKAGVAKFALEKLDTHRWRFSSKSHTTGFISLFRHDAIAQSSVFSVDCHGKLTAREFRYTQTGGDERKQTIVFDWKHNVAHDEYRGKSKTIDIPKGASDPFLAQLKLSKRVANGMKHGRFAVVNRNELDTYHLEVTGTAGVSVPAGAFTVVRVVRHKPGSSRKTVFWLSPKLNYAPVKVAQIKDGDSVFRLEMRSFAPAPKISTPTR
jgi:hypothetical protein